MPPMIVAAIGDSITEGHWCEVHSAWPDILQMRFGARIKMFNLGVSGATAAKTPPVGPSYWQTPQFAMARTSLADLLIVMLGTNDAKLRNAWAVETYERVLTDLVHNASRRGMLSPPKLLFVSPPKVWIDGAYGIRASVRARGQPPCSRSAEPHAHRAPCHPTHRGRRW